MTITDNKEIIKHVRQCPECALVNVRTTSHKRGINCVVCGKAIVFADNNMSAYYIVDHTGRAWGGHCTVGWAICGPCLIALGGIDLIWPDIERDFKADMSVTVQDFIRRIKHFKDNT